MKLQRVDMEDLFLKALECQNDSRPPIWMMRQAGRHLSSYRRLRDRYSFLEMCHEPDLITEVTMLPLQTYDLDAAILFSDILVVAEALGVGLRFEEKIGPVIERPLADRKEIDALPKADDLTCLLYVAEGIKRLRKELKVPLIGFCGAPFTVASYMIEGKSSRDLKKTKQLMFRDPLAFHALLENIADWSIAYLRLQIEAGVQAVQIFDSWANTLAFHQFNEFSRAYLQKILNGIEDLDVPAILFCRGSSVFAPQLAQLHPAGIGLDWNCRMADIRRIVPYPIALQGNLDPDVLHAPLRKLEDEVRQLLREMKGDRGFIFNLGHGISPEVSEEAVRTLIASVRRGP